MKTTTTSTGVMKFARYSLHPFLLAVYFPILLLSKNMGLFDVADIHRAIGLNLLTAAVVFALCRRACGDGGRAAFTTSGLLGVWFSFRFIGGSPESFLPDAPALVVAAAAALVAVGLGSRIPRGNAEVPLVLNVFAVVMLATPVWEVVEAHSSNHDVESRVSSNIDGAARDALQQARLPDELPTIFHIVLDGYSRDDVLRDVYGYDNSPFTDDLRDLGFSVSDRATTPYGQTLLAVNAMLSMNYLNDFISALESEEEIASDQLRKVLKRFFYTAPVPQLLDELGYRLVMTESDYTPLNNHAVDHFLAAKTNRFELTFFETALLTMTPIPLMFGEDYDWQAESFSNENLDFALGRHDYARLGRPLFVLTHILSPHPPFTIDRDGRPRRDEAGINDGDHWIRGDAVRRRQYRDGYLEKLRYTNRSLLKHVEGLIEDVAGPKVIIMHGDHGGGLGLSHDDASATCLKERFSPLLAVYASDRGLANAFGEDTNLVNVYRVLFNELFDTELPLLPARSFFASWEDPTEIREIDPDLLQTLAPASCTAPM